MRKILVSLLLLAGCAGPKDRPAITDEPTYTLIFMDKTRSVNVDQAFVAAKYGQAISRIVQENIRQPGDKLAVYFIHDNTAKARALSLSVRSQKDEMVGASPTDREAAEAAFAVSLQREQQAFKRQILSKLAQQNKGRSAQQTDIWASLAVLADANESGLTVRAYYLSDMRESSRGASRRDFGPRPPRDNAQADEWAAADAETLKGYQIGSPTVTLILPFEPTASARENNPAVTRYWQTLFDKLGVASVSEE
jgi:hypothetical protein